MQDTTQLNHLLSHSLLPTLTQISQQAHPTIQRQILHILHVLIELPSTWDTLISQHALLILDQLPLMADLELQQQAIAPVAALAERQTLLVAWVAGEGGARTLGGLARIGSKEMQRVALGALEAAAEDEGCR